MRSCRFCRFMCGRSGGDGGETNGVVHTTTTSGGLVETQGAMFVFGGVVQLSACTTDHSFVPTAGRLAPLLLLGGFFKGGHGGHCIIQPFGVVFFAGHANAVTLHTCRYALQ